MKISSLKLENFRRFASLSAEFDERLTVIVALNGHGKTTILEGIVSALGPFVGSFDSSSSKHISKSDARYYRVGPGFENEQAFPVTVSASSSSPNLNWSRSLNSSKSKTTIKEAKPLSEYGATLAKSLKDGVETTLPVICYYASSRLWSAHRKTVQRQDLTRSRSLGYTDCLSNLSNFGQLEEWIKTATYASIQQSQQQGYGHAGTAESLRGISKAVDTVLKGEGWCNFHFSLTLDELAMFHEDHGILPASLFSDGVRATVMLVADLALRCVQLNSPLGAEAPRKTPGIVLIDEVDLHLHPAWQQRILCSLLETFPEIQFIVTTHSPQVVSTIKNDRIRVIISQPGGILDGEHGHTEKPAQQTQGTASSDVLANVFAVDPVPAVEPANQLSEYTALVQAGLWKNEKGENLRQSLIKHFGESHPVILEVDRLIRLGEIKGRISQKKIHPISE
ncbi:ATP-binding protein [Acetobacter indonesiensis]|uniref:AAA family ATPase n=1 Tax=Acetobacter indonesiensis TaxID=104101 RepID=UPI000A3A456B|nr:AAA family ATPase [Acetobacter indonesiensis]OUI90113.1 ATP-binding protein [Acetobacter indonesiensis]